MNALERACPRTRRSRSPFAGKPDSIAMGVSGRGSMTRGMLAPFPFGAGVAIRYRGSTPGTGTSRGRYHARRLVCGRPRQALTNAGAGRPVPPGSESCGVPLDEIFRLGRQVGASGTPYMLVGDEIVHGFHPNEELLRILGLDDPSRFPARNGVTHRRGRYGQDRSLVEPMTTHLQTAGSHARLFPAETKPVTLPVPSSPRAVADEAWRGPG